MRKNGTSHFLQSSKHNDSFPIKPDLGILVALGPHSVNYEQQHQKREMTFTEWYPLIVLVFISVILNGMICYLYRRNKDIPKRPGNILLLNQACIDLFSEIVYAPINIISFYFPNTDYLRNTVFMYSIFLSICGLFLLAAERLWSILNPLQHLTSLHRSALLKGIIFIWLSPLLIVLLNLIWAIQGSSSTRYKIYLWVFWALLVTVLLTTTTVYVMTLIRCRRIIHNKYAKQDPERISQLHSSGRTEDCHRLRIKQEIRLTCLGFLLFLLYIIGYYPTVLVNLLLYLRKYKLVNKATHIFTAYSFVLNGFFNPILCFVMKQDYKIALLKALRIQYQHKIQQ